jgi:O-antigen ligase
VAGLAATALAQGGYHPPGRLPLLVGLPAAALLLTRTVPAGRPPVVRWAGRAAAVAGLLGAWGLLRGAVSPDPSSGVPVALLMAAVVLLLAIGRRLGPAERGLVVRGLLAVGVVVAAAGWAGVVWHLDRFAVSLDGVWRAGSTLTYPNAAAALLTLLALPAVALLATRPTDVRLVTVVCLLLVGHLATLSRAGALSLVVGLLVLTALTGWRPMVRAALAPTLGAAVAGAGLWGSFPLDAPTGRWTAVVALLAGLALAVALAPRIAPGAPVGVLGLLAVLAAAVVVAVRGAEVLSQRLAGGSSTRWDAHRAALDAVSDHPWWGAGPGAGPLDISAVVGRQFTLIRFVHDEYVQTLLGLGVLGLLLLLLLVALLVRAASVGSRDVARDPIPAGVLAALVAAAVHGGLDFVWHVPVVPLTAVTLVAVGWAGDHRPMRGNP